MLVGVDSGDVRSQCKGFVIEQLQYTKPQKYRVERQINAVVLKKCLVKVRKFKEKLYVFLPQHLLIHIVIHLEDIFE